MAKQTRIFKMLPKMLNSQSICSLDVLQLILLQNSSRLKLLGTFQLAVSHIFTSCLCSVYLSLGRAHSAPALLH